ncbi:zinc ABC transporter substrate-binding protein [Alkalilimnicola sp. S0819]|uniref:zinc ABC transporter substrate-binding protein n=1 Tax=Alkalilimnicola sp. S0819 TaxID=2613922 RepID=UPI0012617C2E|nr:zinc ABC transporter substrate-binding protein [Alkalilimnicola sp. S0819]KAB7627219.1 zinc ABC transporter substrate-binding protein [Alkalilimnicola sp. S0819]MPQ15932.1 zinc ABC transporter substrate-binding protein [Alkalilimnicola sp. S0819]
MARVFIALILLLCCLPALAAPRVVVSIKPLHSLAAGVMAGIAEPRLLIDGAASPHTYALRPREAQALHDADLVVRVGPALERFLDKPLATLANRAAVLDLAHVPGMTLAESGEHDGGALGDSEHLHHGSIDPHIWLDADNAALISQALADRLAHLDPVHAERYRANAREQQADIAALDARLQRRLEPLRHRPFVVFHDGYGYFTRRYGLHMVGAITLSPERVPGTRQVAEIRRQIVDRNVVCVFSEPQFRPALIDTLVRATQARVATLDPLGADLPAAPQGWFQLLDGLAASMHACLGAQPSP